MLEPVRPPTVEKIADIMALSPALPSAADAAAEPLDLGLAEIDV
jgi:hypothetical protein